MAYNYQKLTFTGYIGQTPQLRYTPSGEPVLNFSVGCTQGKGDDSVTTWFNCTAWGDRANTLAPTEEGGVKKGLRKGAHVLVEGRLKPDKNTGGPRTYERNDGTTGASFDVTAFSVLYLDKFGNVNEDAAPDGVPQDEDTGDIPF